ncbi:hypothetical protein BT69DRAFT_1334004 [Atractiella rhizophila]|nr:hypothetical protein BT69DRAFT_1334004 [Atractiella rhizophila]
MQASQQYLSLTAISSSSNPMSAVSRQENPASQNPDKLRSTCIVNLHPKISEPKRVREKEGEEEEDTVVKKQRKKELQIPEEDLEAFREHELQERKTQWRIKNRINEKTPANKTRSRKKVENLLAEGTGAVAGDETGADADAVAVLDVGMGSEWRWWINVPGRIKWWYGLNLFRFRIPRMKAFKVLVVEVSTCSHSG